jgi:hypothetical protein
VRRTPLAAAADAAHLGAILQIILLILSKHLKCLSCKPRTSLCASR